jgi:hypothetical protein
MVLLGNILQDEISDIKLIQLVLNTLFNLTTPKSIDMAIRIFTVYGCIRAVILL